MAHTPYCLYSGSFSTDNVSAIRTLNGQAYINKVTPVWNGTYFSNVTQQPNDGLSNSNSAWFNLTSNGLQFPPYMDKSSVKVYNDRLLMSETYDWSKIEVIPTSDLQVYQYLGSWTGGTDVGFAFNMPLFEHSHHCGDCKNSTYQASGVFTITIQGFPYVYSPHNSTFNLGAQPESGYMYYMNKESTVILYLSYYTNASQPLQPSEYQPFPLPNLAPLVEMNVPLYDINDYFRGSQVDYLKTLGFIADNNSHVRSVTIWMVVLTVIFGMLALVAIFV